MGKATSRSHSPPPKTILIALYYICGRFALSLKERICVCSSGLQHQRICFLRCTEGMCGLDRLVGVTHLTIN